MLRFHHACCTGQPAEGHYSAAHPERCQILGKNHFPVSIRGRSSSGEWRGTVRISVLCPKPWHPLKVKTASISDRNIHSRRIWTFLLKATCEENGILKKRHARAGDLTGFHLPHINSDYLCFWTRCDSCSASLRPSARPPRGVSPRHRRRFEETLEDSDSYEFQETAGTKRIRIVELFAQLCMGTGEKRPDNEVCSAHPGTAGRAPFPALSFSLIPFLCVLPRHSPS